MASRNPNQSEALAADRAKAQALAGEIVSRETWERLAQYVALLLKWQQTQNLIAPSTIPEIWTRHIADSLQLLPLAPAAKTWVDLGSGAGLPGLVIACALAETPGTEVHLVESNQKKASFLREAARSLSLPAIVHAQRIEDFVSGFAKPVDAVTGRALAPLDKLIGFAIPLLTTGAAGLFPKGQDVEAELTEASKSWKIEADLVPSKTDPRARIVAIRHIAVR